MKIVQFSAENIKSLKLVDITPTKDFIQITGKNGSGKTSILDAIWWALAGADAIQGQPIRKGEDKAKIRLDLGSMIVTRKFTPSGTTLVVENAEGFRAPTPQAMLDEIIGQMTFDPLEFSRMAPKSQFDALKKIADVQIDLEALAKDDDKDKLTRRDIKRDIKNLEGQLTGIVVAEDAPESPVVMADLLASLKRIEEENSIIQVESDGRAKREIAWRSLGQQIEAMRNTLKNMESQYDKELGALDQIIIPDYKSTDQIKEQIANAEGLNKKYNDKQRAGQINAEIALKQKAEESIEGTLTAREVERAKALSESKMPITGLSLGDKMVMYKDIPFDQLSAGEQLKVSVAIAMAANPTLKVIRIKDGSLLDDDSLKIVQEMAADKEYQVWFEKTDTSGKIGIVMEEGEVKAVNAEDAA